MRYPKLATVGLLAAILGVALVRTASAQDPVEVDPSHYKVLFKNRRVRVLRVHYGPHEKSPLHKHPDSVVVYLSDAHVKYTRPAGGAIAQREGKSGEWTAKAGDVRWAPIDTHAIENAGDKPYDAVMIEMTR